jgi:prolyl-tRNA editing enzyme YbaK/EbsC (Cys-tRNA(Pro) deacylase)
MDNTSFDKINQKLNLRNIVYEVLEHAPVFTMEDVFKTLNIPSSSQIKTLVVSYFKYNSEDRCIALCGISATARLDYKAIAGVVGTSRTKLKMVDINETFDLIGMPYGAIGLVVPEGDPVVLVSNKFKNIDYLYFGAGRNDRTIKISRQELLKAVNLTFCEIEKGLL